MQVTFDLRGRLYRHQVFLSLVCTLREVVIQLRMWGERKDTADLWDIIIIKSLRQTKGRIAHVSVVKGAWRKKGDKGTTGTCNMHTYVRVWLNHLDLE